MTSEEFKKWLDDQIESSYDAEQKNVSDNPKFWCGMKMAFIEVKEKYLSILPPPQSLN